MTLRVHERAVRTLEPALELTAIQAAAVLRVEQSGCPAHVRRRHAGPLQEQTETIRLTGGQDEARAQPPRAST